MYTVKTEKLLLLLFLLFFITIKANAINGCRNGNAIYTTYLGTTNFWGTVYQVWSTSNPIVVYNNQDGKNITPCGQIAPTGITDTGGQCWISSTIPPNNNSSGVTWGGNATVSSSYVPCPIDDYVFILVMAFGGFGFYFLSKKVTYLQASIKLH